MFILYRTVLRVVTEGYPEKCEQSFIVPGFGSLTPSKIIYSTSKRRLTDASYTTEVDIFFLVPILMVSSKRKLTAQLPEYIRSTKALYLFLY